MVHVKEKHLKKIRCISCEEIFDKNSDLEEHVKSMHQSLGEYECDKCDNKFVLKWRLNKHQGNHDQIGIKKCHYFNNRKDCPFESIGCMFQHVLSENCVFGNNCKNQMCSYQHEIDNSEDNEIEDEAKENILKDKFGNLKNEEKIQSRMIICDKLCKDALGYHRCSNPKYDEYIGCDIFNIIDELDEDSKKTRYFPCEECKEDFEEYADVRDHFLKEHKPYERIGCFDNECKQTFKTIDVLVMHIGVDHSDLVKERILK